ncbi:Fimbrial subunit type 2 precursor [Microbacterium esteraromaticum]|uniref:Fimbrial subunit type 2 n=1 Tax=Microbacterium esteraromaticum TaxID=57043 RepID=A0A1R4K8K4_9MICO|nr:SpaH/EbpB family LPXTG-anchored major pilin [Microbacterium esteraromaticum]SJN40761.1 Fimbrial subunit type 2 precursor [Microbacterium esteraromaticum]
MNTKKRPLGRLASGVGVIALVAAGLMGGASMASAAAAPGQEGAPDAGTLIVHKYAGSPTSQDAPDGTEQTVDRPPLAGVTFVVTPVGKDTGSGCVALDLGTAAGWTDAQAADDSMPPAAPYCLVTAGATTQITNGSGTATFAGLPLGLYHVNETNAPTGVTPSVEFYVSIPYASTNNGVTDWLYTVHTYPKNTLTGDGDKTVGDPTAPGLGSTVPWTLTTKPIGSFNDGQKLTSFKIIDRLDAKLTYSATPAPVLTYTEPGGSAQTVPAANYTLTPPAGAGGDVVVDFTNLTWLNERPAGTIFTFTFSTTVTGVGSILNTGFQNSGGDDVTLGEASTQWGPAEVLKHQAGDKTKTLAGAKFSVFNSPNGTDCTGTLGAALTVNGATEFESNASGIVTIAGLFVSNDESILEKVYCVVETQEPLGFIKDTTPHMITVKAEGTATTTAHIEVANTPVPGPILPLTGSNGTLWFTVGGIALIVMAAGGFLMVRRTRNHS